MVITKGGNINMKKVLALALALVVCIAGTSLAAPRKNSAKRPAPARMERMNPEMQNMPRAHRFGHKIFTPDMPKEIREKAAELAKLRIDLEEAMTSRPLNKEKALEVHKKIQAVKQDIETWRFTQRLERVEERQKKGLPPAQEDVSQTSEEAEEIPANVANESESEE